MVSEVSEEQQETNDIIIGLFITLIIISDILICYYLYLISLKGPKTSFTEANQLKDQKQQQP